jgi:ElaA protein
MDWICKKFDELTLPELYEILKLRCDVFVVEQNCVYPDLDNKDQPGYHFMGRENNRLVAYTRLAPKGISYPDFPSIGRVATSPAARNQGAGRELMLRSIEKAKELFGNTPIKIGAQLYLKKFYASLGFVQTGDEYVEDGIDHIAMILPADNS